MTWLNDRGVSRLFDSKPPVICLLLLDRLPSPEKAPRILKIFKRTRGSAHEARETNSKEKHMLWTIFVVLLILWLLGFIGHFGGALIHLLLVVAVVVLIINLISGRRSL